MTQGVSSIEQDHGLYARSFADVYDAWYADLDDPFDLVSACRERLMPSATIVELGGGSGRLAGPLAAADFHVISLDISAEMLLLDQSRSDRLAADMVAVPARNASADCVLIAYNTLFNLASRDHQQRCLQEAARVLRPGGFLAIEGFIAPSNDTGSTDPPWFGVTLRPRPGDENYRVAIVTGPDPADPQVIVGSHVEITHDETTCRPWRLVYQSPTELDASAAHAGLTTAGRYRSWSGDPFDPDGDRHVSWYRTAQ